MPNIVHRDRLIAVPPTIQATYPHFGKGDAEVWEQWLNDHQDLIHEVYYDVALGGVTIDDQEVDDNVRNAWHYSTAVKIDAVAVFADENLVIEVKPHARMSAIGQALGYTMLLNDDPINDLPNTPTIVTLDTTQEVRMVASAFGIRLDTLKR